MFNAITLYIKVQGLYAFFLLIFIISPLILFFHFSPYQIPYIEWAILFILFLSQYFLYDEKKNLAHLRNKFNFQLQKELKRSPSKNDIELRLGFYRSTRLGTVIFTGIIIILISMIYNKIQL